MLQYCSTVGQNKNESIRLEKQQQQKRYYRLFPCGQGVTVAGSSACLIWLRFTADALHDTAPPADKPP